MTRRPEPACRRLEHILAPRLTHAGWRVTARALDGRVVLLLTDASGGLSVEVFLEARHRPRSACFATTRRCALYYAAPRAPTPRERLRLEAALREVTRAVAAVEGRLRPDELGAVTAGAQRAGERTSAVLETGGGTTPQHLLRVTFACNQRCPFCFVALGRPAPAMTVIARALDRVAEAPGVLTLSGGEPTLDARLPAIIAAAQARGIGEIELQTNAVRLADPRVLAPLAGLRRFFVSLHSHLPAVYDRLTGSHGQLAAARDGLAALLELSGAHVTVNCIVNRLNHRELEGWVDFVDRVRRGRRLEVFFTLMNGLGHEAAPELVADLDLLGPSFERAVARCHQRGMLVAPLAGECAPPPCATGQRVDFQARTRAGREAIVVDDASALPPEARVKAPSCRTCVAERGCAGVPAAYARRCGLAALRPIT